MLIRIGDSDFGIEDDFSFEALMKGFKLKSFLTLEFLLERDPVFDPGDFGHRIATVGSAQQPDLVSDPMVRIDVALDFRR